MKLIASSLEYSKDNFIVKKQNDSLWTEKELEKFPDQSNSDYLGLYKEYSYEENSLVIRPYYYIGYRWLDENNYIHISPKQYNGFQADYLQMFLTCLHDPIVSKHLDETYKMFFDEKWIEIKEDEDEITPFLIIHFLQLLKNISKKGLKKGYVKTTQNLTSKIKGKILVNQTIKQNHFRNRVDKTVCNYQIFTVDCIENQILKTALLQCSRNLQGFDNPEIIKLLKSNLSSFEFVNSKEVFDSDFTKIKYSPFYKEYKEALRLAKMIFKRFGFALNSQNQKQTYKIPPFYINMPELFERYVEVELRKKYNDKLIPGYGKENGNSYIWELRPDFIVEGEKLIIDAKYKYWYSDNNTNERFKDDFQQLALYGRVEEIRKKIGIEDHKNAKILFIYPTTEEEKSLNDNWEKMEDFNNIYKWSIKIPLKEVN